MTSFDAWNLLANLPTQETIDIFLEQLQDALLYCTCTTITREKMKSHTRSDVRKHGCIIKQGLEKAVTDSHFHSNGNSI